MYGKVNIYDIAQKAGVSIATVSRVLSGSGAVREATRQKVLETVEQLGFKPNPFARGLGLGSMRMVGILVTDVSDIYYAAVVSRLELALRKEGLDALLCCTGNDLQGKKNGINLLLAKKVDAILLVGSALQEQAGGHLEQAARHTPLIVINGLIECEGVHCVLCDERQAMKDNVSRMFSAGCRDILYLYDAETYSGMQKLGGYSDGVAECGMTVRRELIHRTSNQLSDVSAMMASLIESELQFDSVLTSEDIIAVGASKALATARNTLPIIGFNNSIFAECCTPSLSSVDNMRDSLCDTAVGMLRDLLQDVTPPQKVTIAARFVQRDTFPVNN